VGQRRALGRRVQGGEVVEELGTWWKLEYRSASVVSELSPNIQYP